MKGEIGTFNTAEILQFIASQQKTGVLHLRSKGRSAVLFFEGGKIISARDRRQGIRDPFVFFLLENGALGPQAVNKVLEIKERTGGDTVEILLRENLIEESVLSDMLSKYALRILDDITKWESGTYEFIGSTDGMPDKRIIKPVRLEPILMEALRRRDEVEELRRFLPSFDTKLKLSEPNLEELPLDEQDMTVVKLVDGKRTIEQIVEECPLDELETLDVLEKLFALGIVAISEDLGELTLEKRQSNRARVAIMTGLILGLSMVLRFVPSLMGKPSPLPLRNLILPIQRYIEAREVEQVRFALDAYKELHGTYPSTLEALVQDGLVEPRVITDAKGNPYTYLYFPGQDRYLLLE